MWRSTMRAWLKPSARAASTYGTSRTASALARTTRPHRGTSGTVMAMMTFSTPLPNTATTASARMIRGKAIRTSSTRWNTRSNQPPK